MYSFLNRSLYGCYWKVISSTLPQVCQQTKLTFHEKVLTIDDALDDFTSQLTQKKARKWNLERKALKPVKDYTPIDQIEPSTHYDLQNYSIEKINQLFLDCLEAGDNDSLLTLTKECIEHKKCPSLSNLIHVLTLCAQNGDKDTINLIRELCVEFHPDIAKANSYFKHYFAEAVWIKGNISESLKIFNEVYTENVLLRRRIKLVFKYLVQDVTSTRSEAALVSLVKFAQELLSNYNDFFPMVCVWQTCFLSEWFTDQSLALELLERNEGLRKAVISRIPYVVMISLSSHRTEVVYRLLELLLRYQMRMQYSGVLSALLDYQISQGDLRSTLEIIQWSLNNSVELSAYRNEKFLFLLLNGGTDGSELLERIRSVKKETVTRDLKF